MLRSRLFGCRFGTDRNIGVCAYDCKHRFMLSAESLQVPTEQCFTAGSRADIPVAVRQVAWHEGDVIRKLRHSAGWTLQQLAEKTHLSVTAIHDIETGITKEPKRKTLTNIATAFGLTMRDLQDLIPQLPVRLDAPEPTERRQQQPPRRRTDQRKHNRAGRLRGVG